MKKYLLSAFVLATIVLSCTNNKREDMDWIYGKDANDNSTELDKNARQIFGALADLADNPDNPVTDEKVSLGKALYFDTRLSKDNTQSCNTCHNLKTYGVDNKSFSEGNNGGLGDRNSPTTLNAAFHFVQFWDGREPDVEAQAGGPIINPVEMEMKNEAAVVSRLAGIKEYQEMFKKAFPEDSDPITYDNLKKAIGAFERKLVTPSRFDKYMAGDNAALTESEKNGMQTFIDAGCTACHSGSLLGGNMYQKFGLYGNYWDYTKSKTVDEGRSKITENESDKHFFKVPSLRNVEKTYPYFHDGSVASLEDAVKIMGKIQADKDLTDDEIKAIVEFLKTLTGEVPAEYTE